MRHSHAGVGSYAATWFALVAGLALIGYGFYIRRRERAGAFTD
jgi:cytochrome oxidase assembly protein ShyY1